MACGAPPEAPLRPAVYHWKTELNVSAAGNLPVFAKVFDVSWSGGRATPTALLSGVATMDDRLLTPVVFITSQVFREASEEELPRLAEDVLSLSNQLLPTGFSELQIDCDWTAGTQETYFTFLEQLTQLEPDLTLSATVRLHQYRDRKQQGVPPVDRGVLMAYNVGSLDDPETNNSIIDTLTVINYLRGGDRYPLPLDIAVAAYDWAAVYRNNELAYLSNEPPLRELTDTARFQPLDDRRFLVKKSTYFSGVYLYRGDLLRTEVATAETARLTAQLVRRYVGSWPDQRQFVYRLNSRQFSTDAFVSPPPAGAPR